MIHVVDTLRRGLALQSRTIPNLLPPPPFLPSSLPPSLVPLMFGLSITVGPGVRSPLRRENRGVGGWREKERWMDGGCEGVRGEEVKRGEMMLPLRASKGSTCINHPTGGEGDSDG
ncbi:hypothetical protein PBY51_015616 [Eleginops maclovinus]|nr:hypothetical protein PBY51_015616 [Eleginops maclovinus]